MMTLPLTEPLWGRSEKLQAHHLERVAIVYIRQSTLQQVLVHQESTRAQYGLVDYALSLGWSKERVLVIDEDQGKSGANAEGRAGFQRLVAEVGLNHVGLILGVDMSRLARSNKDWHQLLEICALFRTLIADQDGIYDPSDYNDRLLLGLKGTMSEAELHILKQRLQQGRLSKAKRGALNLAVPVGYIRRASGEVLLDPDEQVQTVIRLVFKKFEELGSVYALWRFCTNNHIELGVRERSGLNKGDLRWQAATRSTIYSILKHPIYTGAYVYGRRQTDPRKRQPLHPRSGQTTKPEKEWHVLIKDVFPAYISWQQFERNQQRLRDNQTWTDLKGAVREGPALLPGLLRCGYCGHRMFVRYSGYEHSFCYTCAYPEGGNDLQRCRTLPGPSIDTFISTQVLAALEPASLTLSLQAATQLEAERTELDGLWQQRLERSRYETDRAQRHYQLLEPENRLVARQLAKAWEEKLTAQQQLEEDYRRFLQEQPRSLTPEERNNIEQLAHHIPVLWNASTTHPQDRKDIIRQVIQRITITMEDESERVLVKIDWVGNTTSQLTMNRSVARREQLSYYSELCDTVRSLAAQSFSAQKIADQLNLLGFKPPKRHKKFAKHGVIEMLNRLGICKVHTKNKTVPPLPENEWYLTDLARQLNMARCTLRRWAIDGWVKAYQQSDRVKRWVIHADAAELKRLETLLQENTFYKRLPVTR